MNFRKSGLLLLLVLISGLSLTTPAAANNQLIVATAFDANRSERPGSQVADLAIPSYPSRQGNERSLTAASINLTTPSFSEKWVNGGLNTFAPNKSALVALHTYYGKTAVSLMLGGLAGGALVAGLPGAIVGAVGGNLLANRFNAAQTDIGELINAGATQGGCRITVVDEFPIASLASQTQATTHNR